MTEEALIPKLPQIGIIPIHFDVPVHYIPLDTFVETAGQTRVVIEILNQQLFDGKLEYEFVVFPPDEGSFLSKLGIVLAGTCTFVWAAICSDPGKEFIRGLTGHEPGYYTYLAGLKLREYLTENEAVESLPEFENNSIPTGHIETGSIETDSIETDSIEIGDDAVRREAVSQIVVESTKSFMTMDEDDLRRAGVTRQTFHEAYDARNQFYQTLAADQEIRGVGFDETPDFPIKRKDFIRLQVPLAPKEERLPDIEWEVEIAEIKVTSPNWSKDDEKRPWKGKDHQGRDRYFRVEDAQFWHLVHSAKLDPKIIDTIRVQWAFPKGQRRSTMRVLRVLKFNDVNLGDPLDDNALSAALGSYLKPAGEDDLFTRRRLSDFYEDSDESP